MDVERALITKILSTGQLQAAVSRGIREDLFEDDECRDVWRFALSFNLKYKSPPSSSVVKDNIPTWEQEHVHEPLEYLLDAFIVQAKRVAAYRMLQELAVAVDDPERGKNIDNEFIEVSRNLAMLVPSTEHGSFSGEMEQRIEKYEQRKGEGQRKGIPFGFPSLDHWTGGIQPHQLVTVAGFTGTGKSTLLKIIAFNAWVQGYTPLYFSLEEDGDEIYERLDAMAAGLNFNKLRQLQLPDEDLVNWRQFAEKIKESAHDIPIIEGGRNVTPDLVYAEMVRHKPDLVVIDYVSLMRPSSPLNRNAGQWQSVQEITQDLKRTARTMKIPILMAAQTNRSGGKDGADLDNIGYSISINQDSDIVIGLFADEDMKKENLMEIRLNKNRRGRTDKFHAIWDHENGVYREKTMRDRFGLGGDK